MPSLSATVEHPVHTAGAEVPGIEQHTTTSLAFLSQSAPNWKAEEAAHPTPDNSHPNTLPQTKRGSRTVTIHPGCSNINRAGKTCGKSVKERKEATSAHEIHMAACLQNMEEMPVQSSRKLGPLGVAEGQVRSITVERWWEGYKEHYDEHVESAPLPLSQRPTGLSSPARSSCSTHPSFMIFSVSLATW